MYLAGSAGAATRLTKSTINIGYVVSLTGVDRTSAKSIYVAQAWEKWVNATGGLGGHPVKIIIEDSKNDPATAQADVQDLVQNRHVVAIAYEDTKTEATVASYLTTAKMPVIGGYGASTATWSALPNWFSMSTTIPSLVQMTAMAAKLVGSSAYGVAACAETASCAAAQSVYQPAAQTEGLKWTGLVQVAAISPDYSAQCLTMMNGGTDFFNLAVAADVGAKLVTDCQQQGYKGAYGLLGNAFQPSQLQGDTGIRFAGNINAFPWWVDAAPVVQFRQVMAKYAPTLSKIDYGNGASSTIVWAALQLFKTAVGTPTGNLTAAQVMRDYDKLHNVTLGGLLPQPLTFKAGQPAAKVTCGWLYSYTPGSKSPSVLHQGPSGNGQNGPLRSSCWL